MPTDLLADRSRGDPDPGKLRDGYAATQGGAGCFSRSLGQLEFASRLCTMIRCAQVSGRLPPARAGRRGSGPTSGVLISRPVRRPNSRP